MLSFKTFCEEKETHVRDVYKKLSDSGFEKAGQVGSHEKWKHKQTGHSIIIAHHKNKVSPGVVRQVRQTIASAIAKRA